MLKNKIRSNNFILTRNHGLVEFGRKLVCDQLRTSFEPASVMLFGFYLNYVEATRFSFLKLTTFCRRHCPGHSVAVHEFVRPHRGTT